MKLAPLRTLPLLPALALWLAGTAAVAQVPVIIAGEPAAPPLSQPGGGLCVTSKISTAPGNDFPTGPSTFNASLAAFIDSSSGSRVTSTLRTVFDLSNNNSSSSQLQSYGDFTNSSPSCPIGGCGFFINDTTTSFASRFRGYLNVTATMVGRPLHFGFYADDAVSFVIYDRNQTAYPVVTRPPEIGSPTWRTTNSVTFSIPGLYPVEIFYAAIVEHSALELSVLDGTFTDFELQANLAGSVSLKTSGFQLLTPTAFFQTEDGSPPFANLDTCAQCSRQYANVPGNGGCGSGYYCNGAALCAPCTSSYFCGQSCAPCGGSTPVCAALNSVVQCVQCTKDGDCRNGHKCNLDTFQCQECTASTDCPRGRFCNGGKCEDCSSRTQCAGASCNCCSGPDSLKCAPRVPGELPSCVECTQDSDCAAPKKCDTTNGRCVETLPECNTSERCGPECVTCPLERPFCLDGKVCVQCRSDIECGAGKFCVSGECSPCATDRRCGLRCEACAGDTPFCAGDGTAAGSACVRCRDDGDCNGGTCDRATHTCSAGCQVTCGPGTYCDGSRCVACYANAHCPCGGSCDPARNVCTSTCDGSGDCSGSEYCTANQTCARGRRKPGVEPRGGGFCCDAPGRGGLPEAGLFVLLALMILKGRRGFVRPGRGG